MHEMKREKSESHHTYPFSIRAVRRGRNRIFADITALGCCPSHPITWTGQYRVPKDQSCPNEGRVVARDRLCAADCRVQLLDHRQVRRREIGEVARQPAVKTSGAGVEGWRAGVGGALEAWGYKVLALMGVVHPPFIFEITFVSPSPSQRRGCSWVESKLTAILHVHLSLVHRLRQPHRQETPVNYRRPCITARVVRMARIDDQ